MQYQQWPLLSDAVVAGSSRGGSDTGDGAESSPTSNTAVVLLLLQLALPVLLLAGLLVDLLFFVIRRIGDKMGGWSALEDDEDDILLATVKAKEARRRRKRDGEKAPETRPRKTIILLALVILALSYSMDGSLLILASTFGSENIAAAAKDEVLWAVMGSMVAYTWYSMKVYAATPDAAGKSMLVKVVSGLSLTFHVAMLTSMSLSAFFGRHLDSMWLPLLLFQIIKVAASIALALAYHSKLREPAVEGREDAKPESGHNSSSEPLISNPSDHDGEDDEDEDEEDEKKKKRTLADWPSIIFRFRCMMPLILPRRSPLSYVLIIACISLTLVSTLASTLEPRQFGIIVDDLVMKRSPWHSLLVWGMLRIASQSAVLPVLVKALWTPVANQLQRNIDIYTFEHVLGLGMIYHTNKKSGEVLSVLSRGGIAVAGTLDYLLFQLAPMFIKLAGSFSILALHFGPGLFGLSVITSLAYISVLELSRGKLVALGSEYRQRSDNISAIKNESISNVELLKYFAMEPYEVTRYSRSLIGSQKADWEWDLYLFTISLLRSAIQLTGTLIGATAVAAQVHGGKSDVGVFVMYLSYISTIVGNMNLLASMSQWTNQMMTNTDKVFDILDEKNEIQDDENAEELYECKGEITFENVTLIYPGDKGKKKSEEPRKALDNVSFTVRPGQHVALVGETGAGKSTIFKVLYRFFECQEGSVKIDGKDIRHITQRSLRQALGVVQQEGSVLNDSIFANIKYGDISAPDEKVMEAAKMAQLHDKVMEWPKKYQTVVGERGVKLSGGEKQRVNIARTILKNPKILLLDEATSALDTNTEKAIQGQLRRLTRGKTTLAIAHRLSTIAHADKIIVLDKGKIVETGTHEELIIIEDGFYKKLWEAQISAGKSLADEEPSMEREGESLTPADGVSHTPAADD